jgi:hypothetical protein
MALGEINELGLHLDETTHYYHIVDRQVSVENKDLKVLDVTGLSSTVSKFDFTTKLSPALTTMIAISAQAGGSDVGVDASALLRWNEGLSDRIITDRKVDRAATTEKDTEDQQTERQKVYASFLQTFYKDKQFDVQKLEEAQRNYSQYAATYMNKYDESKGASGPAGIVPFEVGIDLDGISGIKIGQAFKINEGIMPTKYNGAIGFIITGVSHKISNNKWITSLKAQTVTLSGNKPQAKPRKEVVIKGFNSSTPTTNFVGTDNDAKKSAETYLGRVLTAEEWSQLVSATFAESGYNQTERAHIMAVMLNRVRSGKWGNTVTSVLTAKSQFQAVTGTSANGHAASPNYVNGPNATNRDSIYGAATNILPKVAKNLVNFTSNLTGAYGAGTNIGYRDTLFKRGGFVVGDSVFSS